MKFIEKCFCSRVDKSRSVVLIQASSKGPLNPGCSQTGHDLNSQSVRYQAPNLAGNYIKCNLKRNDNLPALIGLYNGRNLDVKIAAF